MILSDSLPVQFWLTGYETYNEKELFGFNTRCFCQPWECGDEIKIQFQDTSGLPFYLLVYDEDDILIDTLNFNEDSPGVYSRSFIPDSNTPDICDQKILLKIRQGDTTIVAKSDCLDIKETHDGTIYITYSNGRNYAGIINYSGGTPDISYYLRIPAVFNQEQFPETDETLPLSNNRIISLNSQVKKQRLLETDQMPYYMHLKVMEVLKNQFITIDGVDYVKEEPYEQVSNTSKKWPMRRYTCWLTEKQYVVRNIL